MNQNKIADAFNKYFVCVADSIIVDKRDKQVQLIQLLV
jgi:hypothetical protein